MSGTGDAQKLLPQAVGFFGLEATQQGECAALHEEMNRYIVTFFAMLSWTAGRADGCVGSTRDQRGHRLDGPRL